MALFDLRQLIASVLPARKAAGEVAARWSRAADRDPDLVGDLIRLSGLMALTPDTYDERTGLPMGDPVDANRMLVERGRQDMARQLLALMSITPSQIQQMMEDDNDLS